jgi:NAD(P)-dependent dehydrogenase (short-subunit alcohol dehydrogenase family)
MNTMGKLAGETAVVTGASKGIGTGNVLAALAEKKSRSDDDVFVDRAVSPWTADLQLRLAV